MIEPMIYHGEFWIPSDNTSEQCVINTGTLQIVEGEKAILAIHKIKIGGVMQTFDTISVVWGSIADDFPVTLFGVRFQQLKGTSYVSFTVRFVLCGQHVRSLDTPAFNECVVKYPHLHNWASTNRLSLQQNTNKWSIEIDKTDIHTPLIESELDSGERAMIFEDVTTRLVPFKQEAEQSSYLKFQMESLVSINHFYELIVEFTQFFAIAQYFQQYPTEIYFRVNGEKVQLLYSVGQSDKPRRDALIQFSELKGKLPEMIQKWHSNYKQVSPICRYLLQTVRHNTFDFPDFLIVAHALEGYHKRFLNKKDGGKDKRKYKEEIGVLLDRFKDVEVIKRININTEVLEQSRDKYSHLIPDEEKPLAVEGLELYALTKKCKVLLTCCILDLLGLDTDEINLCCEKSYISTTIPL